MMANIFENIPANLPDEFMETLIQQDGIRIERIVSKGHATPDGKWFDQETDEWFVLLQGSACLLIEGEKKSIHLRPGDYLHLPAHVRHRVEWTDPAAETVWLAVHYYGGREPD